MEKLRLDGEDPVSADDCKPSQWEVPGNAETNSIAFNDYRADLAGPGTIGSIGNVQPRPSVTVRGGHAVGLKPAIMAMVSI